MLETKKLNPNKIPVRNIKLEFFPKTPNIESFNLKKRPIMIIEKNGIL